MNQKINIIIVIPNWFLKISFTYYLLCTCKGVIFTFWSLFLWSIHRFNEN